MLIVRATKKLRDLLPGAPAPLEGEVSTTVLGDWFATILPGTPAVVLLVNGRTSIAALLPLDPVRTLLERVPDAILRTLHDMNADDLALVAEQIAMGEARLAPTNDRSVVAVMSSIAADATRVRLAGVSEPSRAVGEPGRARRRSSERQARSVAAPSSVHVLKVTLLRVKPPVWRRIVVDGASSLDEVHEAIQAAFGWWNYHLYEFEIGRRRFGIPDPDDDFGLPMRDAQRTRLDAVATVGTSFRYTYDFGDGWEHQIAVESTVPRTDVAAVPACIGGRRACPPEDCGGPAGYADLLRVLADPDDPQRPGLLEWLGGRAEGGFDPEAFDPADFDDNLAEMRMATFDDD